MLNLFTLTSVNLRYFFGTISTQTTYMSALLVGIILVQNCPSWKMNLRDIANVVVTSNMLLHMTFFCQLNYNQNYIYIYISCRFTMPLPKLWNVLITLFLIHDPFLQNMYYYQYQCYTYVFQYNTIQYNYAFIQRRHL